MTTISNSWLLVNGYIRELLLSCNIPIDIIREINNFFYELFPHLFAIKVKDKYHSYLSTVSKNTHEHRGIEYIDMHRKVSTHLNIFDIKTKCFIKDIKDKWDCSDIALVVDNNFHLPPMLQKLLPANARESKNYNQGCTAIFKIGDYANNVIDRMLSSMIIIDRNSIYSEHEMEDNSIIINGYQLSLPSPNLSVMYYQLEYHSADNCLYSFCNTSHGSDMTSLFRLSFNSLEETEAKETEDSNNNIAVDSPLKWKLIAEKEMDSYVIRDGTFLCIPKLSITENEHLMFLHGKKARLFPLEFPENIKMGNDAWIDIKDSNFDKMSCGVFFDSVCNCLYVGCGYLYSYSFQVQRKMDVYDFHKNQWFGDILPEVDTDFKLRSRPKLWMQNRLLFMGGGGSFNNPDVIFVDMRDNKKQWKVFGNQWDEYFVMESEKEEQQKIFKIERIL